jgi:ABC-type amino acid transport system permease subunit
MAWVARRKVTTTVYIEPEQDSMLKALSARTRVPVAEYIRQGIDLVLEAHREELPGQLGLFDAAEPPAARRRDEPAGVEGGAA